MHGAMSAAALLGPGRSILVSGFRSAARGAPDMNSLVSLGAVAAFGVSCVAAAMPQLAWRTFFEEPAMLLGVVLMGRTLEQRAKLQASSDMVALRVSAYVAPTKDTPVYLSGRPSLLLHAGSYRTWECGTDVDGSSERLSWSAAKMTHAHDHGK